MATINVDEEDDDYWGIVKYEDEKEEKENVYQFLWVSELLLL